MDTSDQHALILHGYQHRLLNRLGVLEQFNIFVNTARSSIPRRLFRIEIHQVKTVGKQPHLARYDSDRIEMSIEFIDRVMEPKLHKASAR